MEIQSCLFLFLFVVVSGISRIVCCLLVFSMFFVDFVGFVCIVCVSVLSVFFCFS